MRNYTHLVDKFSPLVRDMDLGSSMMTDMNSATSSVNVPFSGFDSGHLLV